MPCVGCGRWDLPGRLCEACRGRLRPAPERILPPGFRVRSAYVHDGVARLLVHRLKYQGIVAAAPVLVTPLVEHLQPGDVLVPVPRARIRRYRFGVDQAEALARALGALGGIPVVLGLRAPLWARSLAGRPSGMRRPPSFRSLLGEGPWVVVDDVVTTGATLQAACLAVGRLPRLALTATSAPLSARAGSGLG